MSPRATEAAVLDQLIPQLQAEGYEVFPHPRPELLPSFLEGFRPDAIALSERKKLAIEITSSTQQSDEQLRSLEKRFDGQKEWELRLIWVSPATIGPLLGTQSRQNVVSSLRQVRLLLREGHTGPALLIAWATFEAIARMIQPDNFQRPQTPGRLVELLGRDGTLTPTEADLLRNLSKQRNGLIHGEIGMVISAEDVAGFAEILDGIVHREVSKKTN